MTKMTERESFGVIENVFATIDHEYKDEILEFVKKKVAAIDKKNEAAKKRAAEKREAGNELRDAIEGLLTDEPKTVNDIIAELGDATVTPAKVTARTTQLINSEKASKVFVKVEGRKLTAYVRA